MSRPVFVQHLSAGGKYFSPLLLNAILAHACQISDWPGARSDPEDPCSAGNHFFVTAKELLDRELERPSVTTVQALALMASREAGCARDARGWLYSGMCVFISMVLTSL
jgi:Fungal specific transcription factor domain